MGEYIKTHPFAATVIHNLTSHRRSLHFQRRDDNMYSTVVLCLLAVSGALAMPVTDSLVATVVMTTAVSRPCDPGYICFPNSTVPNPTDGIMGYICPVGHFCPTGALEEIPCPIGSYSNLIGLTAASECVQCPAGHYCSLPGLQAPLGLCDPGYFCIPGSQSPTPFDGACPEGYYCPTGSVAPIPCPVGTMNPASHSSSVSECVLCPAGQYCNGAGLQAPTGHCSAGYFCIPGSHSPTPVDGACPEGHYCPTGSAAPIPCPIGTMNPVSHGSSVSECVLCPAGQYCSGAGLQAPTGLCSAGYFCTPGSQTPTPVDGACPEGCYCPTGSAAPIPCPVGTMNPVSLDSSVSECVLCPAGQYCNGAGLQAPTGHCSAGYFCIPGSHSPTPVDGACPEGHFCPTGSAAPVPCPVGTMNPVSHSTSVSECVLCPAGQYCSGAGLQTPTGHCSAGYFCTPGSHSPTPVDSACPEGHYCPTGSAVPSPCPVGTVNPDSHGTNVLDCRP